MTRLVKETRRRRTPLLLMALLGVTVGVLIGGGSFSSAASTSPSVANYQQCSDKPGAKNVCGGGWLNGILNAGGSQYAENDATAQRLVIDLPRNAPGGTSNQKFTLKYLWNKGGNHAYDSLVKWNTTISGLDAAGVCAGVSGTCPANSGNFNGGNGDSQFAIPQSSCTTGGVNGGSAGFGIASRDMVMFGGTITNITTPVNDSSTCSMSADEYETLEVDFTVTSFPARVMFLFGGHLACGTNRNGCWGSGSADTNGSSAINGGPYHIKLLTIDGTTAGNQDNQIMSSAIAPLTLSNLSTTPAGTPTTVPATWSASINDSATVTGSSPTGTVTFNLYAPGDTNCGTSIYSDTEPLSSGSATSGNFTDIGSSGTYGAGTYQWVVSYSGDSNNSPSSSSCGDTSEQETLTAASTTDATASP
jgi:hypothetical protein